MEIVRDHKPYHWINEGVLPFNRSTPEEIKKGNVVANILPPTFPAYIKLFHPIYEDLSIVDKLVTWDQVDGEKDLDKLRKALPNFKKTENNSPKSVLVSGNPGEKFRGKRITWEELAKRYDLIFHSDINPDSCVRGFGSRRWPRYLVAPTEGFLEKETWNKLSTILNNISKNQDCYFYYVVLATKEWNQGDMLFRGRLDEGIEAFDSENVRGSATFWWPKDRSWCVSSDNDLSYTFIGGSKKLAAALLKEPYIETVKVTENSRIDSDGDMINV